MRRRNFLKLSSVLLVTGAVEAKPPVDPKKPSKLIIEASQSSAHKLPEMGFRLDYSRELHATIFPEPGVYASIVDQTPKYKGFNFELHSYSGPNTSKTLEAFLKKHLQGQVSPELGRPFSLPLAGASRQALGCLTTEGEVENSTEWCAILLPRLQGAVEGAILLLGLRAKGGKINSSALVQAPAFQPMLKTLSIQ